VKGAHSAKSAAARDARPCGDRIRSHYARHAALRWRGRQVSVGFQRVCRVRIQIDKAIGTPEAPVAERLRPAYSPGNLNLMCRLTFAAVAAVAALSPLHAQVVPGRDLFTFPLGTLAEAPALATVAGGGFWNPATIALRQGDRALFSASALETPIEQGVSARLGTAAYRVRQGITAGLSIAQSSVGDLLRTDDNPQTAPDEIPYSSMILSGVVAAERGPATLGLAIRRRTGTVDRTSGRSTSLDIGGTIERPAGLPFRAALSSFLLSPSRKFERASAIGAIEGYLPRRAGTDTRAGVAFERDEGGGTESFYYGSGRVGLVDLRGGIAQQTSFGSTTTRLRLGVGLRYSHYTVAIAREDGTAGLGASYQFLLATVIPRVLTR